MVDIISHVESDSVVYLIKYSLIQYDMKLYINFTPIHDINILLARDFILLLYNFVCARYPCGCFDTAQALEYLLWDFGKSLDIGIC